MDIMKVPTKTGSKTKVIGIPKVSGKFNLSSKQPKNKKPRFSVPNSPKKIKTENKNNEEQLQTFVTGGETISDIDETIVAGDILQEMKELSGCQDLDLEEAKEEVIASVHASAEEQKNNVKTSLVGKNSKFFKLSPNKSYKKNLVGKVKKSSKKKFKYNAKIGHHEPDDNDQHLHVGDLKGSRKRNSPQMKLS